ncbi:hypothetical protein LPB90_13440 [Chryseobacterium sp. LC2016-29]|uniref:hypothetical protein n=1 Tax=Chryseobacterium sp. LC2016-29 TaxID=2897331 RepID=UPI001E2DB451|nr:hypothetical protein [Chryseobacterium sp. LC2016-29]MCD0479460.1 hypothetical protein [Chryseobacterium sp. LC2016-29]
MTKEQKNEIRQYLLSKKLPVDLLMEVEDHFISQINEVQAEKKLSFDDAFNVTIISWYDDLKLSWDGNWSLEDTSVFIKKSTRQTFFSIFKKSAMIAVIMYVVVVLFYVLIPFEVLRISLGVLVSLMIVYPLIVFFKEKKYFDLPKKYKNIRLSAYQDMVSVFFILPMSSVWYFRFILEMNDNFLDPSQVKGIVVNSLLLFFFIFEVSIIVCQKKYLETIKRLIPYLQENFKVSN